MAGEQVGTIRRAQKTKVEIIDRKFRRTEITTVVKNLR